jgi:hypothetical protein
MTKGTIWKTRKKNRIQNKIKKLTLVSMIVGLSLVTIVQVNKAKNTEIEVTHIGEKTETEVATELKVDLLTAGVQYEIASILREDEISVENNTAVEVEKVEMLKMASPLQDAEYTIKNTEDSTDESEESTEELEVTEDESEPVLLYSEGSTIWTTANVNVRSKATVNSDQIGSFAKGSQVKILEDAYGDWVHVQYKEKDGYVSAKYTSSESPMIKVRATAYWDKYSRHSASGRELVKGKSVAGMVKWLGKYVNIYSCNEDGSVGKLLGTYRFDDTGYGSSTGEGSSKILEGKSVGTIENGTCIDMYMNNESECYDWGVRNVYIQFVEE